MWNLRGAEFQLGGVLSAERTQVRPKIFLRTQALNRMAARASFFQKETMPELNLLLCWLTELWNATEQVGIG